MSGLDAQSLGERIAEARTRASFTQAGLASEAGLERSVLAKIETGSRRVSALELARIADAVDERIEWFVQDVPSSIVSHRDVREPGTPSPGIDRFVEKLARNVEFLEANDSRFASPAIEPFERPASAAEVEKSAARARAVLGLDAAEPLMNASEIGARAGLYSFSFDLGADSADAASILLERGAAVLVNGHLHGGRRRLALVHDWGHCFFADEYSVDWRVAEDAGDGWESRLDHFARAVLLPADGVRAAWADANARTHDDLRSTAVIMGSRFRVDMSTLARRLLELGHLDAAEAGRVRQVRTTKADIVELNLVVHDELQSPELPTEYEASVVRLVRQEIISPARATDLLVDTWTESDLPAPDTLPEAAIWTFVS